jgi:hypothetical protein
MKKNNLVYLLSAITLFFSCSPTYKASQTPDDVYYSPAKKIEVAERTDQYQSYPSGDDAYLRMKAHDHDKWADLDDYNYWYDSRYYNNNFYSPYTSYMSLSLGFGSMGYGGFYPYSYNPYGYNPWTSVYNPYYTVVYYKNPSVYYRPARNNTNFSGYSNKNYNNHNNNYSMPLQNDSRSRTYNNSSLNMNRTTDKYYNPNQNSNPVRTFNNSSSNMSSGGGSRISGGGMRTRP